MRIHSCDLLIHEKVALLDDTFLLASYVDAHEIHHSFDDVPDTYAAYMSLVPLDDTCNFHTFLVVDIHSHGLDTSSAYAVVADSFEPQQSALEYTYHSSNDIHEKLMEMILSLPVSSLFPFSQVSPSLVLLASLLFLVSLSLLPLLWVTYGVILAWTAFLAWCF